MSATVRAKFRCLESGRRYTHTDDDGNNIVRYWVKLAPMGSLKASHDDSSENNLFFGAAPLGEIELWMVSESAASAFTPGQAYCADFTPTDG
jgi:hypothetical protein